MAGIAEVREGLARVRDQTERIIRQLEELDEAGWRRPTNCPPWDVQHLAAHLARGAESFTTALERGLQGILELPLTLEQRQARQREIAAQGRARILVQVHETAARFDEVVRSLMPDKLDTRGGHPYGPREAAWFVQQRLAEVVFHLWDLRVSLGLGRDFDEETARWLLPMLVERNVPAVYAREPRPGGAFGLAVRDAAELAWTLRPGPEQLEVTRGLAGAELTIRGDAAALALLVYGRMGLEELEREGRVSLEGDRGLAGRFQETFRGP